MAGRNPWSKIRDQMPKERRQRIEKKADALRIGLLLAELRKERGLTQTQLAELLSVAQPSISQMEAGEEIQLSTLRRVLGAMGGRLSIQMPNREIVLEAPSETA